MTEHQCWGLLLGVGINACWGLLMLALIFAGGCHLLGVTAGHDTFWVLLLALTPMPEAVIALPLTNNGIYFTLTISLLNHQAICGLNHSKAMGGGGGLVAGYIL